MPDLRDDPVGELIAEMTETEVSYYRDHLMRVIDQNDVLRQALSLLVDALEGDPAVGLLTDKAKEKIGNARFVLRRQAEGVTR